MPILIGRLLVTNWVLALFFSLLGGLSLALGVLALVEPEGTTRLVPIMLLPGGALFVLASLGWIGRRRAFWLLAPWVGRRYVDVAYFSRREGDWPSAVLHDGTWRRVCPAGATFFDRSDTAERREERIVGMLEAARIRSGGDPHPERIHRPRTPLG